MDGLSLPADNIAYFSFDEFEPLDQMDPCMARSIRMARIYARYDGCLMIRGEAGAGGEVLAQAIHNGSRRASGPFVTVDCASEMRHLLAVRLFGCEEGELLPGVRCGQAPGKFEAADGGTIFLREVGDIPFEVQKKLISLVRDSKAIRVGGKLCRSLNVRVITSASRDIRHDVRRNVFSRELYELLASLRIDIPPLRERRLDIRHLARRFLDRCNARYPEHKKIMTDEALLALESYHWPGNVRELMAKVEQIFFSTFDDKSGRITAASAEDALTRGKPAEADSEPEASLPDAYEHFERSNIKSALEKHRGDVGATAFALGISRASLYRKMKNFGITAKAYRDDKKRLRVPAYGPP
ncbi:MAG: sigma 54-interacting transcriptional regulator [Synergistaceae bacterium]|jgi:transcriptional regulator with PAS, ATPase and Fis domain|nr:sigma 54-interacting transcriptional regulator [Synergistaceae bacterium]